ncbi:MAG: winged helix-turn-helix domain-containing protein [Candidatus Bathyarchaeia archaeon]|nr:DUF4364 family protein [Candidatus Bathyarchaeota archaeon]
MGRAYRSKYDIIADILEAAINGARKTRIMHMANVNYHSFCKYFNILLKEGLIEEFRDSDGGLVYRTTEAGLEHLRIFARLSNQMREKEE